MANVEEIAELPNDPIGGSSGEHKHFSVKFFGKQDADKFPYTVANELVATFIGKSLGLNLPFAFPHKSADGTERVLIRWHDLVPKPATELAEFVKNNPHEVHGAIVFDLYVANNDRSFGPKRRNLEFGPDGELVLIDQGNACFYRHRAAFNGKGACVAGIPRLEAVAKDLSAMDDLAHFKNNYFNLLENWDLVDHWCERIKALPNFLIESAVAAVPKDFGHPTPIEREKLTEFLLARKNCLLQDIVTCRGKMFPKLPERKANA